MTNGITSGTATDTPTNAIRRVSDDSPQWAALAAVPALLLVAWQTSFVWPFFSDDAFISLRYAERMLAGCGLTWTDGERVEGYSNLLWVLLCALLGGAGFDLVDAARFLGGAATAGALWCVAWALRPQGLRDAAVAAPATLLVASTQVVLGWTTSGLEGPLVLLLLAWSIAVLLRALAREPDVVAWPRSTLLLAGAPLALLCLTRPDAPLWVLALGIALALGVARRGAVAAIGRAFWLGLLPMLAVLAQLLFRVAYYGDVVPNTAHVKAGFEPSAFGAGVDYVLAATSSHAGLFVAAALGAGVLMHWRSYRTVVLVLALPVLAWLCYLAAIGGDHFPGRRLLHGAIAPLALLAAAGARALATTALRTTLVAAVLLLAAGWNVWLARTDAQSEELRAEIWEWRGLSVGEALHRAFGEQRPRLAVDAAGAVPFYSALPALDLLGLCDRTIATTPVPAWVATMRPEIPRPPGHMHGNGDYVMSRAPDLMLFSNPPGLPLPVFASALELEDDPRFLDGYRCVLVDLGVQWLVPGLAERIVVPLWLRVAGKAGVRSDGDTIAVPAYLFGSFALREPVFRRHQPLGADPSSEARAVAELQRITVWYTARTAVAAPDGDGRLQLELRDGEPAKCDVTVPAGRWRIRVEPADAAVDVSPVGIHRTREGVDDLWLSAKPGATLPVRAKAVVLERER